MALAEQKVAAPNFNCQTSPKPYSNHWHVAKTSKKQNSNKHTVKPELTTTSE
jgi:hypothetical protein